MKRVKDGFFFYEERNGIKIKFEEVKGVSRKSINIITPDDANDLKRFLGKDVFNAWINRAVEVMFSTQNKGDIEKFRLRFKQKDIRKWDKDIAS